MSVRGPNLINTKKCSTNRNYLQPTISSLNKINKKKEKSLNTLNLRKTNPFSIIPCKTNISNIKKDISKSFYRDDLGHFNYDTSLNYDPHEHFS